MRLKITFSSPGTVTIPWNYLGNLQGVFYHALDFGIPQVARKVHDEGFPADGKIYKLATFSLLYPQRYRAGQAGMVVEGAIDWWVSSPVEALIEACALGLLKAGQIQLGKQIFALQRMEVVNDPVFAERMIFQTLSPLVVSTGYRDPEGKFHKQFISPDHAEFSRILNQNLLRKAQAMGRESPAGEVNVRWLGKPRSKLIRVNQTNVRGWLGRFEITGPAELIALGYRAGFGERNAQGFGMVGLSKTARPMSLKGGH